MSESTPVTYSLIQAIRHHPVLKFVEMIKMIKRSDEPLIKLSEFRLFHTSPVAENLTDDVGALRISQPREYAVVIFGETDFELVPFDISLRDYLNGLEPREAQVTYVLAINVQQDNKSLWVQVYRNLGIVEEWRTQAAEAAQNAVPKY